MSCNCKPGRKTMGVLGMVALGLAGATLAAVESVSSPASNTGEETTAQSKVSDDQSKESAMGMQKATFAAGCFWGVESTFQQIDGVVSTQVGYVGGTTPSPTYKQVCSSTTGHAEAVEVTYDPETVGYDKLLEVFWSSHNPTTMNRQGPDVGSQYRSAIFFYDTDQEAAAKKSKDALAESGKFKQPIVTQIVPATTFHRAEEYHQSFLAKQGRTSCSTGH